MVGGHVGAQDKRVLMSTSSYSYMVMFLAMPANGLVKVDLCLHVLAATLTLVTLWIEMLA